MGAVTALIRRGQTLPAVQKDRQASPARLPNYGAGSVAYTWDGKIGVQAPGVYRHWAKTSEWVRGAIGIRRSQVSSADWDIVPYDQRKRWSRRDAQRIKRLFQTPNPSNDSYRSFIEPVTQDLLVLDAGCIEKVRTLQGELVELWPTDAATIKIETRWDGNPNTSRYYWYPDGYTEKARWKNEDFIYMILNPQTNTPLGMPPLETLRATVEAEMAAHEYNRRQVENAAPDGIINLGEGFTEPQVQRFREFFESEVAGRGPLGFIGGTKDPGFIKFRDSNRDQQFLEWQIYLVRKIAVVFGLTPQDLGVTFDVNRSTSEIQLQVSEDRGLRPLMAGIQEYLTEEVVWDRSFGGPDNNLAFRFTALNLKESTAKAAIYEKALAGVPWRYINEARVDEGREPIPEMEGKLIMETPQGALDISDVPTVREYLEMQSAAKAAPAPSSEKNLETVSTLAAQILQLFQPREAAPAPEVHIDKGAVEVNVTTSPSRDAEVATHEGVSQGVIAALEAIRQPPEPPVVNVEAPDIKVEAPVVHVAPPEVNVDTASFAEALRELREEFAKAQAKPKEPGPVLRREVKRDQAGRIIEVIDHRGE